MADQVYKYRIWCNTDSKYEYQWSETAITKCPVDTSHSVTLPSVIEGTMSYTDLNPSVHKMLGQHRPTVTTAISLYAPAVGVRGIIKSIVVANTKTAAGKYTIYIDEDGSLCDDTTMLLRNKIVNGEISDIYTFEASIKNPGHICVQVDVIDRLTFTVFGYEIS